MVQRLTSRTAFLTGQTCLRKRYLGFHYAQTGLSSGFVDLNLLTGTAVHRGLQHLLEHCRVDHPNGDFEEKCIDTAVEFALEVFKEEITTKSINLHSTEMMNVQFVIEEHECLIEGLIRAFAIKRLKDLLEEYEVLEVEHEEIYELSPRIVCPVCLGEGFLISNPDRLIRNASDPKCSNCNALGVIGGILFLAKADGLFRRKSDNKLIVLSIKTTSEYPLGNDEDEINSQFSSVVIRNILHDMQGCSETAVIQDRIDRAWNRWEFLNNDAEASIERSETFDAEELKFLNDYHWFKDYQEKPEVYAVQYEHLVTGKRRQSPAKSGIYKRSNFLIHPIKFESQIGIDVFGRGKSFSNSEYKWKWGSGKHPKGWNSIDIWNDVGIKLWVDLLASGKIQPELGNPLDEVIRTSELIIRTPEDIKEWKISIRFQEERISQDLDMLEIAANHDKKSGEEWSLFNNVLAERFPKNTQSCHNYYGNDCTFVNLCHGGVQIEDSLGSLYQIRHPHHELEEEEFKEKGLIK